MTGMQTARLTAESQGRKAKVIPVHDFAASLEQQGKQLEAAELTNILCNSLPVHTMSYWSTYITLLEYREGSH